MCVHVCAKVRVQMVSSRGEWCTCMRVLKYVYNEHPDHYYVFPYSLEPEPFPEPAAGLATRDPSVPVPHL